METLFPFGFPGPTAMYLALFVLTAAIYTVFMQYVLAGSIVLLVGYVAAIARSRASAGPVRPVRSGLMQTVLRDWLPAILGLAIAAGIAPLLFLQVLYRREFYAASQLLFIRSLLLVLALIIACLLLYLLKTRASFACGPSLHALVSLAACGCLLFTAWAWTGNHVLGLHDELWQYHYHFKSVDLRRRGGLAAARLLDHRVVPDPGGGAGLAASLGAAASSSRRTWISRRAGSGRWRSWGWEPRPPKPGSGSSGWMAPRGQSC